MPRAKNSDDRGSASIEFIAFAVLVLVPMWYLMLALGNIQAATLAAEGAARHGARMFTLSSTESEARRVTAETVRLAMEDFGLSGSAVEWTVKCIPHCESAVGRVEVGVNMHVDLPLAPPVFAGFARVPISATAAAPLSRFR